jgi:hypothetical protein
MKITQSQKTPSIDTLHKQSLKTLFRLGVKHSGADLFISPEIITLLHKPTALGEVTRRVLICKPLSELSQTTVEKANREAKKILPGMKPPTEKVSQLDPLFATSFGESQYRSMIWPEEAPNETDPHLIESQKQLAQEMDAKRRTLFTNQEIRNALKEWNGTNPLNILERSDFPDLALEALRRGFLHPKYGSMQAGTMLHHWKAVQNCPKEKRSQIRFLDLTDENVFNQIAHTFKLIRYTQIFQYSIPSIYYFLFGKPSLFLEALRKFPTSEHRCLFLPKQSVSSRSISEAISAVGINLFNEVDENTRMVASLGAYQGFLSAQFGKDAVQLKPLTYLSSEAQIRKDGEDGTTRTMMVGALTPIQADELDATGDQFTFHDFYHGLLASALGKKARQTTIKIADAIRKTPLTADKDRQLLEHLRAKCIDMEFLPWLIHYMRAGSPLPTRALSNAVYSILTILSDNYSNSLTDEKVIVLFDTIKTFVSQESTDTQFSDSIDKSKALALEKLSSQKKIRSIFMVRAIVSAALFISLIYTLFPFTSVDEKPKS